MSSVLIAIDEAGEEREKEEGEEGEEGEDGVRTKKLEERGMLKEASRKSGIGLPYPSAAIIETERNR